MLRARGLIIANVAQKQTASLHVHSLRENGSGARPELRLETVFERDVLGHAVKESILRKRENGFQKCIMCISSYSTCVLHGIVQTQELFKSISKSMEKRVDGETETEETVEEALPARGSGRARLK